MREQLQLLLRQLESRQSPVRVHEVMTGLLKRVLLSERRRAASALEEPLGKVVDPAVVGSLRRELLRFDDLLSEPWAVAESAQRVPKLTDFLSIQFARRAMPDAPALLPRALDEKFNVLAAPRLFFPDLAHYRHECGLRGVELCVAYLDIDDFKSVNTRLTETVVDLCVLAPFMELIEAWVFGRGHAYRFGGDEYVLLLPNVASELATRLLADLRARVACSAFRAKDVRLSITQGACVVDQDCHLTDHEILGRANAAKARAKVERKGSVAVVKGPIWDVAACPLS